MKNDNWRGLVRRRGITLVEVAVVTALMSIVVLGIAVSVRWSGKVVTASHQQMVSTRLMQDIFTRLRAINFYDVYGMDTTSMDASSPDNLMLVFGPGHFGGYPAESLKAIQAMQANVKKAGLTAFRVDVLALRRTLTAGGDGGIQNLVPVDLGAGPPAIPGCSPNGSGVNVPTPACDYYDPLVCFVDYDCDGDFFEGPRYDASGAQTLPSEFPDTHIKLVTVTLMGPTTHNDYGIVAKESQILSLEGMTGISRPAQQSGFSVSMNEPAADAVLYSEATRDLRTNRAMDILQDFVPPNWTFARGDTLQFRGITEPSATVDLMNFRTGMPMGQMTSDLSGVFSDTRAGMTNEFVEGWNTIRAHVTKGNLQSPFLYRRVLFDSTPPRILVSTPTDFSTVRSRRPYVEAFFSDLSGTTVVSGLGPPPNCYVRADNDRFRASDAVRCIGDPLTGRITFFDPENNTLLPTAWLGPAHGNGSRDYYVRIEAEDRALYRASATWRFTVDLYNDNKKPVIEPSSVYPPPGGSSPDYANPLIQVRFTDPATVAGRFNSVDPMTFKLCINGVFEPFVDSAGNQNYPMGSYFDARTQTFHYLPPDPLSRGEHRLTVTVRDWYGNLLDDSGMGPNFNQDSCNGTPGLSWQFFVQ